MTRFISSYLIKKIFIHLAFGAKRHRELKFSNSTPLKKIPQIF
jgi:hypothetical protein